MPSPGRCPSETDSRVLAVAFRGPVFSLFRGGLVRYDVVPDIAGWRGVWGGCGQADAFCHCPVSCRTGRGQATRRGVRRCGRELFALRVVGESMINAGILDGDYVVAHKTPVAENGDIVVALLEDEATVKRFFREDGHIRLQPENPAFQPIISEQVVILGRLVSLIRNYN